VTFPVCLFRPAWAAIGLLGLAATAMAATPTVAQTEVHYLLAYIESSECEFYRNGAAYDAAHAAAHLRSKYASMDAAGRIPTAEDFIDRVASRSSLTGRNYDVQCAGQERRWTAPWLRDVLARLRSTAAPRS
jgi:hypothetical protein